MTNPRTYQVGIVGEASYQPAIRQCESGQLVDIIHEPDNPYDEYALAVSVHGKTIGYIPRDCWLQDAIHEEGRGCDAQIKSISAGAKGLLGVVLDVSLSNRTVGVRAFESRPVRNHRPRSRATPRRKSWLERLLGG